MFSRSKTIAAAATAAALAGVVGAVESGAGASNSPPQDPNHLSGVDRATRAGDALGPQFLDAVGQSHAIRTDADWSQARRTRANVWVARGDSKVCLHEGTADSGPTACGPAEAVSTGGALLTFRAKGDDPLIAGLVPDGVDSVSLELEDGSVHSVAVASNTYTASFASPAVKVTFSGPDGTRSLPVPVPQL